MSSLTFALKPTPPFRLDWTAWALRRRTDNMVDRWDGTAYRRALVVHDTLIEAKVTQTAPPDAPRIAVTVTGARLGPGVKSIVTSALERLLGIRLDLSEFYRFSARDRRLDVLTQEFRGFKPPRFLTIFEAVVNAIACQQVTLVLGIRLLNRLAQAYGPSMQGPDTVVHAFPRPQDLADLTPEALRSLGFSYQKARALVELSGTIASGQLDLKSVAGLDDESAISRLRQLRGVGRWTAEYVLLRGLGRIHVFPGDDVGARNNLQRWLGLADRLDYEGVRRTLARWSRYGGLVYLHLLLRRLVEEGSFDQTFA